MATTAPPLNINPATLDQLLADMRARESLLSQIIQCFEAKYQIPLESLEERLERGEYDEHPAWEDLIEWRNAVEQQSRTR